jgi:hypothetical protein
MTHATAITGTAAVLLLDFQLIIDIFAIFAR